MLAANTDIGPYLLPIDHATHVQTLNYSFSERPLLTDSTLHDTLTGSFGYVDPDVLNRAIVTMQLNDPGVPLTPEVAALQAGFSYTVESFGNYGMVHWTYDVQDKLMDFMSQGTSLKMSAKFSFGGGTFTDVNINLQGANDVPVVTGPNTTFADVALHNSAEGSFVFNDPDWFPDGHGVTFIPQDPDTHGFMIGASLLKPAKGPATNRLFGNMLPISDRARWRRANTIFGPRLCKTILALPPRTCSTSTWSEGNVISQGIGLTL